MNMNKDYGYPHPGQQPPAPEPEKKMSGLKKGVLFGCLPLTVVGILAFGGCAVIGGAVVNEVDNAIEAEQKDDHRALREDVKLTGCDIVTDEFFGREVKAKVKVTNNGDKRADYVVTGEFLDDNRDKVEELIAVVDSLEPGKSSTQDFSGLITSDQLKGIKQGSCVLLEVDRSELLAAGN